LFGEISFPHWLWVFLIVLQVPVSFWIGTLFWKSWGDFFVSVRYWFTPDIISIFRGEFQVDLFETAKLLLWAFCCFLAFYGEVKMVWKLFF
jgi:hypothetical protein